MDKNIEKVTENLKEVTENLKEVTENLKENTKPKKKKKDILKLVEEKIDEKFKQFETLLKNLQNNDELEELKKDNEKLQNKLKNCNFYKNKNKALDENNKKLLEDNQNLKNENESLKFWQKKAEYLENEKTQLSSELSKLEKQLNTQKIEIKNSFKQQIENLNSEIKEKNIELEGLKNIIFTDKFNQLFSTILNNETLLEYRKKYNVVDNSIYSAIYLFRNLCNARTFINSFYDDLVEYKKSHQTPLSDNEVEFYKAINEYFDEEIIKNPTQKVYDGSFERDIHRGINNERDGEIDEGIILIPAMKVDNKKMKVKLKK